MFQISIPTPEPAIVAWHRVIVDRRPSFVEVLYSQFENQSHVTDFSRPPTRQVALIQIKGDTAGLLLSTTENRLYDDVRALIGRLLTGTATEQEQGDASGWQALASAVLVQGVVHLDSDPFELEVGGE